MDSFHNLSKLSITSFRYDCNCLPSYLWNLFPLLSFFLIFEKHSAAEVVHQAFTAQFSYIPRVGLTRCNAFPFGQLFKREVLRKCGEQRRTTNSEQCHFDLNQKHKPHLSRSTISKDFSDRLSPVSPCLLPIKKTYWKCKTWFAQIPRSERNKFRPALRLDVEGWPRPKSR